MPEKITFHFEGGLADEHRLNFYEAARFQYAAARLLVKIIQFRTNGKFAKSITDASNQSAELETHSDGSFDITIVVPVALAAQELFLNVSVSNLLSYVFERLVAKVSNTELTDMLNEYQGSDDDAIDEDDDAEIELALAAVQDDHEAGNDLTTTQRGMLERRLTEKEREKQLKSAAPEFAKIDIEHEQKLVSMSGPLVREMAVALRRSADTLEIKSQAPTSSVENKIVFLDRKMAKEIEVSNVDRRITPILGNIIQYNKETGWGKARLSISQQPLSFNVPSDIKHILQRRLLAAMGNDQVHLQIYIVRDKAQQPIRFVIAGILPAPTK